MSVKDLVKRMLGMETMYIIMFVDTQIRGRNTTVLGMFSTKEDARNHATPYIRGLFGASKAPIFDEEDEDEDQKKYFLIHSFDKSNGAWVSDD
jgi:hypothetical protein